MRLIAACLTVLILLAHPSWAEEGMFPISDIGGLNLKGKGYR